MAMDTQVLLGTHAAIPGAKNFHLFLLLNLQVQWPKELHQMWGNAWDFPNELGYP